jgi:Ser/Thr protein kinase RdoA (MazF antagonist)
VYTNVHLGYLNIPVNAAANRILEEGMTEKAIRSILSEFGVTHAERITQVYVSAWNIDDKLILKRNTDPSHCDKSIRLSNLLIEAGLPVARYYKTTDGKGYVRREDGCYCLMSRIAGSHLDPYSGNPYENGRMLGTIVATLHSALKGIEDQVECPDVHWIRELDGWIKAEIQRHGIAFADGLIEDCYAFVELYDTLPRQLIHRDMHLQNLVFSGSKLAGYLDFDSCQRNARILDVCYLGASMLVGNYRDLEKVKAWSRIFCGVIDGYSALAGLNEFERAACPMMFVLTEVIFSAFYAKLGDSQAMSSCVDITNWMYENRDFLGEVCGTGRSNLLLAEPQSNL